MSLLRMIPAKHNTFWKGALSALAFAAACKYVDDHYVSNVKPCPLSVQADYFKSVMNVQRADGDNIKQVRIIVDLPSTGKCAVEMRMPGDLVSAGIFSEKVRTESTPPAP